MVFEDVEKLLGGLAGFRVRDVRREGSPKRGGGESRVVIELEPVEAYERRCSRCDEVVSEVHDVTPRWVQDLPILDSETWLILSRARLRCPKCGPTVERVPWLDRYARMTKRFKESVARLCQVRPIKHVAAWFGIGWDAVKAIDKSAMLSRLGEPDLSDVRVLAMDEFALRRGHRYATVVLEAETKAEIVYDLFHVVAKYGREVIDRVRVDRANELRHDTRARRVIKGARWFLLRNKKNLATRSDRIRLKELLAANRSLWIAYVLRNDLVQLWRYRQTAAAKRFWKAWYRRARSSVNNKIKVIERMAYGFRDDSYFFLKIRSAFPGITG